MGYKKNKNKILEIVYTQDLYSKSEAPVEESIKEDDGVFYISEDVISSSGPKDRNFKVLVDSVMGSKDEEESEVPSIFSDREVNLLDLGSEIDTEKGNEDEISEKGLLIEEGIDYDFFLEDFNMNITGISKSLLKVSQKVNALCAAILTKQGNKVKVEFSVGMDSKGRNLMAFRMDEPFYTQIFEKRAFIFVKGHESGIESLDNRIKKEDRTHFNGYLYIPVRFQGQNAYLFAGLKTADVNLDDYIKILTKQLA